MKLTWKQWLDVGLSAHIAYLVAHVLVVEHVRHRRQLRRNQAKIARGMPWKPKYKPLAEGIE